MGFNKNDIKRLAELLATSGRIVITCHFSPDGDALGSSLGLKHTLNSLNPKANVTVVTADTPPHSLDCLYHPSEIVVYSRSRNKATELISDADVIVCLDFNELSRTDLLEPFLREAPAIKVQIDHHVNPENFAFLTFSYPEKCATCQLLFEVLEACGFTRFITSKAADCLLAGMMTDTGDFSYNVTDPETYSVIGKLIALGADKARLTRLLFNTFPESNLRIQGYALAHKMEVFHEQHAALITLNREELNEYGYKKGDTEGLVNKPLAIPGILYSCFLREETDYIKVSMRSLGDFSVNEICNRFFEGGGHRNAAGGEFHGTMEECIKTFKSLLDENLTRYILPSNELKQILKEELN